MILCLNLNAAIDKTIVVASFELNKIHRPESVISLAGGKGCNVARALKTLGEEPVVSGWVGGFAGEFIETELHREGIKTDFIHTEFESRTCTSILDRQKQTMTEVYEAGEPVSLEKIEELQDHLLEVIGKYKAITLSGSLPPGVPADFYASVIEIARKASVLTFLDTSDDALRKGAEARPFFIKPNETEAKSLLRLDANESLNYAKAASELSKRYGTHVLLSLGENGAVAANVNEVFVVKSPRVEAKSAVGSGDCALAGFAYGILHEFSFVESIIYAMAAGTANTLTVGAGQFKIEDFERLRSQIHIPKS